MNPTMYPYSPMYQFLIDEFQAHLAKANEARALGDHAKYLVDWKKRAAMADFKIILAEFSPSKAPPLSPLI